MLFKFYSYCGSLLRSVVEIKCNVSREEIEGGD